jgi:hypothetical protein
MQVRVANGQTLSYTHELVDCPLWISGHGFKVSLKILPLNYYDITLGIDWLESHSPMEVDWKDKWLSFDYLGSKAVLQGITTRVKYCEHISNRELETLADQDQLWCLLELRAVIDKATQDIIPPEVQGLVDEF